MYRNYLRGAGASICLLCKYPLHPCITCWEARHRRREEQRKAEELDFSVENEVQPFYLYSDSLQAEYVHQTNTSYYDEQDWYDDGSDPRLTKSSSYQEEYEYDDYYHDYSQPSYQNYQVEYYDYQHKDHQPSYENHQFHQVESFDEMMRKRHMAHVEQELTKPHLSKEDRLELLEWKYDLLPKEVKEVRPRMSSWEKRQAKQEWLAVQFEEMVVEEFEDECLQQKEEYTIEIIVEEPPMKDRYLLEQATEGKKIQEDVPTDEFEDMCLEVKKVTSTNVKHIIKKWFCNNVTYLLILGKKIRLWKVNYRVYVGNSVGKCGLRPGLDCSASMNIMIKLKPRWINDVNYRAYIGNAVGKCALRPP